MQKSATRLPIVGVMGSGTEPHQQRAFALGQWLATQRVHLLTGGGGGVMESVCAAFASVDDRVGKIIGILPGGIRGSEYLPMQGYPNQWIRLPIYTGAGMARNAFNVLSANLCVALGGGPGTLSEIALALKAGAPVWCWQSWQITPPPRTTSQQPRCFATEEELMAALRRQLMLEAR